MKVSELFEAQGSPGQKGTLQSGAYYKPGYDEDKGQLRGSVKDWLKAMGATPQDVAKALSRFKASPLFRNDAAKAGLEYESRPAGEKNGTLAFKVERKYPNGNKYKTTYLIYANGQIRGASESAWGKEYMGKLMSPKPRIKAGDPIGSIVMLYTAALQELLAKWKKSSDRMAKADAKEVKESVSSAWEKLNDAAEQRFGEFGFATLDLADQCKLVNMGAADKLAAKSGAMSFSKLPEDEMKKIINANPSLVKLK